MNSLEKALSGVNLNTKTWAEATDEVVIIANIVRVNYNELTLDVLEGEKGYINIIDRAKFNTPSKWNKGYVKFIKKTFPKLSNWAKVQTLKEISELF